MVFVLPPTAGEKITLASINSLILCAYLIYFQSKLPALGDQLPLLGKWYDFIDNLLQEIHVRPIFNE